MSTKMEWVSTSEWDPFDPPFVQTLSISIFLTSLLLTFLDTERPFVLFVLMIQFSCYANALLLKNKTLQYFLHDAFVYGILYGNLISKSLYIRLFVFSLTLVTLVSRFYFNRCMFLGWQTTRNQDFDVVGIFLIIANWSRTAPVIASDKLAHAVCAFCGIVTHLIEDRPDSSILFSL